MVPSAAAIQSHSDDTVSFVKQRLEVMPQPARESLAHALANISKYCMARKSGMASHSRSKRQRLDSQRMKLPIGVERRFSEVVTKASDFLRGEPESCSDKIGCIAVSINQLRRRWRGRTLQQIIDIEKSFPLLPGFVLDTETTNYTSSRANFCNAPNNRMVLYTGTTHVAIGFSDLSLLLNSEVINKNGNSSPLLLHGVDQHPFYVAKTQVIVFMLESNYDICQVLQVWYSSTWNADTQQSFKDACRKSMLHFLRQEGVRQQAVIDILKHWVQAPSVSLAEARRVWLSNLPDETYAFKGPMSALRSVDREALTSYTLTGDLATFEGDLTGSVCMYSLPPPYCNERLAKGESAFNSIFTEELINLAPQRPEANLVELLCWLLGQKLGVIRSLLQKNELIIRPQQGQLMPVSADEPSDGLADWIADQRPKTVSWSNVPDYFNTKDFHDLAKRISCRDGSTRHYAYLMNWVTKVYGTSIWDYLPGCPTCAQLLSTPGHTAAPSPGRNPEGWRRVRAIIDDALRPDVDKFSNLGWTFRVPCSDLFTNLTTYSLARQYCHRWEAHFFDETISGRSFTFKEARMVPYSVLYQTSLMLYVSWMY